MSLKAIDFVKTLTSNYIENSVSVNIKINENTLNLSKAIYAR
jgi:hypothetical protein